EVAGLPVTERDLFAGDGRGGCHGGSSSYGMGRPGLSYAGRYQLRRRGRVRDDRSRSAPTGQVGGWLPIDAPERGLSTREPLARLELPLPALIGNDDSAAEPLFGFRHEVAPGGHHA